MNKAFFEHFMEKEAFPAPACSFFCKLTEEYEDRLDHILSFYNCDFDHASTIPLVDALAEESGCSPYSIWMVILIMAAEKAQDAYPTDELFWEIYQDLRYKLMECHNLHGIWGTFVSHWYPRFSKGTIVQLGRLQYEVRYNAFSEPVTAFNITVNPDDPLIFMHIPSSGEPFDAAARMDSYKRAYDHFCNGKGKLVCVCASWLLYPGYEKIFSGNIADFRKDFYILRSNDKEIFGDKWRVFGKDHKNDPAELPENTSLQRAFKQHILDGGSFGSGVGIFIFDGKNILTRCN